MNTNFAIWAAVIAAAIVYNGVRRFRLSKQSLRWDSAAFWPTAAGHIEMVDVLQRNYRRRRSVSVGELRYSYAAGGAFYSGCCQRCFRSESEARAAVESTRGKAIQVRYNPADPSRSCFAGFAEDLAPPCDDGAWLPEELLDSYLLSIRDISATVP